MSIKLFEKIETAIETGLRQLGPTKYDSMTTLKPSSLYAQGSYNLFVVFPLDGRIFDLTPFHVQTTITQDFKTSYTTLDVVLKGNDDLRHYLDPGNWLFLYGPYFTNQDIGTGKSQPSAPDTPQNQDQMKDRFAEIERAQIVESEQQLGAAGTFVITAKDPSWLLAKNKVPTMIPEGTASERLAFWALKGLIKLRGSLIHTEHIISSTRGGTRSIWDEIQLDLAETNKVEDKRYVLRQRAGEFYIQDLTTQGRMWAFEVGNNIFKLAHRRSIQDYANIVYVQSNQDTTATSPLAPDEEFADQTDLESLEEPFVGFAINKDDVPRYGQHIRVEQQDNTDIDLTGQQQADTLLAKYNKVQQTAMISTYGIPGIMWGDQVLIYAHGADMSGVYWVRAIKLVIRDGSVLMDMDIDFDYVISDELRTIEQGDVSILWDDDEIDPASDGTDPNSGP